MVFVAVCDEFRFIETPAVDSKSHENLPEVLIFLPLQTGLNDSVSPRGIDIFTADHFLFLKAVICIKPGMK